MAKAPKFYQVNLQQFIAIDAIASVDDYGSDVGVRLKTGEQYRINEHRREGFLAIIKAQSA
jgi:hypothetical protein